MARVLVYQSYKYVFLLIFVVISVGCSNLSQNDALLRKIDEVQNQLIEIDTEVTKLKLDQMMEDTVKEANEIAFLRPGTDGYSIVHFDLGVLTVSFEDVSAFANGSKVTIIFGNPLSATIRGLNAEIEYGKINEDGSPDNENMKRKSVSFVESMSSGSWTNVSTVLEGIPPTELGFIRIKNISHKGIRLNRH